MSGPSTSTRTLRDHLREDFALQQLIDGLVLADRFHFYVLLCPSPRVADEALALVLSEVSTRRPEGAELFRIDPYLAHPDLSNPIEYTTLIRELLEPLVHPVEYPANGVVIADASRAIWKDEEAWRGFFGRLNERRNVVVERLRVPLILSMPFWMERVFAETAPDFWAIQSLTAKVEAPEAAGAAVSARDVLSVQLPAPPAEREKRPVMGSPPAAGSAMAQAIETVPLIGGIAAGAPGMLAREDMEAIEARAMALRGELEQAEAAGDHQRAWDAAHARAQIYRLLVRLQPARFDWHVDLATAIGAEAGALVAIGRSGEAMTLLEEAVSRMDGLADRASRTAAWRTGEAPLPTRAVVRMMWHLLATTARVVGNLARARRAADRAVELARALRSREPNTAAHAIVLARGLLLAGQIARQAGSEDAPAVLDQAVAEARAVLAEAPEVDQEEARALLQATLLESAGAREEAGRASEAVRLAEEAAALSPEASGSRAARALIRRAYTSLGDADRGLSALDRPPIKLYISYSDQDSQAAIDFESSSAPLLDGGQIRIWHRGKLRPGDSVVHRIARELEAADVFVALLSADYLASEEQLREARAALARGSRGEARIVPVRVRACVVEGSPFEGLPVLPLGAESAQALPPSERWSQVVSRLEEVVAQRTMTTGAGAPSSQ